jgi:hypothetical protein
MIILWILLGPVGMIFHPPPAAAPPTSAPTTAAVAQATSPNEPPPAWIPTRIGQFGREQYLSQLMVWCLPGGVLAMIIVSLATAPPPKKQVDDFFMLLRTPVGQEQKLIDAGVHIIYAGNTTASPMERDHPTLVHWGGFVLAALICAFILLLLMLLAWIGS